MEQMQWGGACFNQKWLSDPLPQSISYNGADYPNLDICAEIQSGRLKLNEGDILIGFNFALPAEELMLSIPFGVILKNCTVSRGAVEFSHGICEAIEPGSVAIANGPNATAIKRVDGAHVLAFGDGAKTIDVSFDENFDFGDALRSGKISLEEGAILKNLNFALPTEDSLLTIPYGVILDNCTVSHGAVEFSHGICSAIGSKSVAIANGPGATALKRVSGARVFAVAEDAMAILVTPDDKSPVIMSGFVFAKIHRAFVLSRNFK